MEDIEMKKDTSMEEREKFLELAKDLEDTINLEKIIKEIKENDQ